MVKYVICYVLNSTDEVAKQVDVFWLKDIPSNCWVPQIKDATFFDSLNEAEARKEKYGKLIGNKDASFYNVVKIHDSDDFMR